MATKTDTELIARFLKKCAESDMTLREIGATVHRTKAWASLLCAGKIASLRFQTRNRIIRFLKAK